MGEQAQKKNMSVGLLAHVQANRGEPQKYIQTAKIRTRNASGADIFMYEPEELR